MRIAITGDTHMPRGSRRLPKRATELLASADLIVHTGDFTRMPALEQFEALGPPLHAVHGNVDEPAIARRLPETLAFEADGVHFGVIHDAGPKQGRLERMRRSFPDADTVLFGHSHVPLDEVAPDGFRILNPGSPTERRRAPWPSMAVAEVDGGALEVELVRL